MDLNDYNRRAWDAIASSSTQWFYPVTSEQISEARSGQLRIRLTATKDVPESWLQGMKGKDVLCLAAAGGHQGPLLSAFGANVTVADFSEQQLAIDRKIAESEHLQINTVQCDMRDLGEIGPFDYVINPCSTNFCSDVDQVWKEAFRVLRPGGILMTGVINPVNYIFDAEAMLEGDFLVANSIPFQQANVDPDSLDDPDLPPVPAEFGHSLQDLIGGQMTVGFQLTDFFEDRWGADDPLSERIAVFAATRAIKPE